MKYRSWELKQPTRESVVADLKDHEDRLAKLEARSITHFVTHLVDDREVIAKRFAKLKELPSNAVNAVTAKFKKLRTQ